MKRAGNITIPNPSAEQRTLRYTVDDPDSSYGYHLIVLDPSKRKLFERKLVQYKERLRGDDGNSIDLKFRIALVDKLLKTGLVSPWKIMLEQNMSLPDGWWFDPFSRQQIANAISVVVAYMEGRQVIPARPS